MDGLEVGYGLPVWLERRRSMDQTFSVGVRRDDMGLSGRKKTTFFY